MNENTIQLDNPLTQLGFETDTLILPGQMGAICARAGIGKTSFLVQVGLFAMARGQKVLHISLDEPVNKINLWYREVFNLMAPKNGINRLNQAWNTILPNRLIMTLKLDGFSVPRLEERLADMIEQDIFKPETLVIDGFPFDSCDRSLLKDLKILAEKMGMSVWFTVTTHRHEEPDQDGYPVQLSGISDLFNVLFQMVPENKSVNLKILKGQVVDEKSKPLFIDTDTMLIYA
jgi:hypothetical protein